MVLAVQDYSPGLLEVQPSIVAVEDFFCEPRVLAPVITVELRLKVNEKKKKHKTINFHSIQ